MVIDNQKQTIRFSYLLRSMHMEHNQEIPDDSQYRVHSRRQVIALLKDIMDNNQQLTLLINHGPDSILTVILDIDEDNNSITIDAAKSNTLNDLIVQSRHLHFEALHNNIRVTFVATKANAALNQVQAAITIPIPDSLIRLQRRDAFRVITPITKPLRCFFRTTKPDGTPDAPIITNLSNISIGGVGLIDESLALDLTKGRLYKDCKLELNETTSIPVNLEMRDSNQLKLPNGKVVNRFGCAFVGLSNQAEATIQRTITQLERNQNAKASGRL
jgi:c-di-GMP-binding flagellar brake protein YcgR